MGGLFVFQTMLFPLCVITIFFTFLSGTDKVRIPGLGLDPDHSAKNGPEKVRNWAQGPDLEHQEGFSIVLGGPYCH